MKLKSEFTCCLAKSSRKDVFEQTHHLACWQIFVCFYLFTCNICYFSLIWEGVEITVPKCQPGGCFLLQTVNWWQNEKQLTYLPNYKQNY